MSPCSVAGVATPATFNLTNTAGAAMGISQLAAYAIDLDHRRHSATALTVTVRDGSRQSRPGRCCDISVPASGASATLSSPTATTNAAGIASVTATANATPGTFTASAAVTGIATPVTFNLTNTGTPGLTLAVTPSATVFTTPGETLTFSYVATNTGNLPLTGVTVVDPRVTRVSCPATTLAVGARLTCTGTTTVTTADVVSRRIVSVARAIGTASTGSVTSTTVTTPAGLDAEFIRKRTAEVNRGLIQTRSELVTTMTPNPQRVQERLSGSLLGGETETGDAASAPTRTPAPAPQRHEPLKFSDAAGAALSPGLRVATPSASTTLRGGIGVPSIFEEAERGDAAARGTPGAVPFTFGGAAEDGNGRFNFGASLSQMRAAARAEDDAKLGAARSSDSAAQHNASGTPQRRPGSDTFDVWIEGQSAHFTTDRLDGKRQGHAAVVYSGIDMVVRPGLLVGVMAQRDWISDQATGLGSSQSRSGTGWMAGPYIGARLTQHLFVDARYARGQSDNKVDPIGAYTDKFATTRELATARITGNWTHGLWSIRPSAEVTHYSELQKAYVKYRDFDRPYEGLAGSAVFGPEIGYRMDLGSHGVIEPFAGIKGVWDFAKSSKSGNSLRGRIEAGASLKMLNGLSLRGSAAFDGIGSSSYRAWQGQAVISMPLN